VTTVIVDPPDFPSPRPRQPFTRFNLTKAAFLLGFFLPSRLSIRPRICTTLIVVIPDSIH